MREGRVERPERAATILHLPSLSKPNPVRQLPQRRMQWRQGAEAGRGEGRAGAVWRRVWQWQEVVQQAGVAGSAGAADRQVQVCSLGKRRRRAAQVQVQNQFLPFLSLPPATAFFITKIKHTTNVTEFCM